MAEPKRLGELVVEWGLITQAQLSQVLALQKQDGRRLGVLLVESGLIHATKLTQVLSHQFHLPFVSLARVRFTQELLEAVPAELARSRRVVPFCLSGKDVLFAATDDPGHPAVMEELASVCGREVRLMVAAPDELQHVLDEHYGTVVSERPSPPATGSVPTGAVRVAVSEMPAAQEVPFDLVQPKSAESYVEELGDEDLEVVSQLPQGLLSIVVVDCEPDFAELCERSAEAQGLRVETAGLMSAEQLITKVRPVAIVMMEDVFAMERLLFTRLSIEVGAHLVIWSDDLGTEYLEPLLAAAKQSGPRRAGP